LSFQGSFKNGVVVV